MHKKLLSLRRLKQPPETPIWPTLDEPPTPAPEQWRPDPATLSRMHEHIPPEEQDLPRGMGKRILRKVTHRHEDKAARDADQLTRDKNMSEKWRMTTDYINNRLVHEDYNTDQKHKLTTDDLYHSLREAMQIDTDSPDTGATRTVVITGDNRMPYPSTIVLMRDRTPDERNVTEELVELWEVQKEEDRRAGLPQQHIKLAHTAEGEGLGDKEEYTALSYGRLRKKRWGGGYERDYDGSYFYKRSGNGIKAICGILDIVKEHDREKARRTGHSNANSRVA